MGFSCVGKRLASALIDRTLTHSAKRMPDQRFKPGVPASRFSGKSFCNSCGPPCSGPRSINRMTMAIQALPGQGNAHVPRRRAAASISLHMEGAKPLHKVAPITTRKSTATASAGTFPMHCRCVAPHGESPGPVGTSRSLGRLSAVVWGQNCEIPLRDVRLGFPLIPCYITCCASLLCTYPCTGIFAALARVPSALVNALVVQMSGFGFFVWWWSM